MATKKETERKVWERQPGESIRAYEALREYLDMGPKRSITKVAEKLGKSTAILNRWSRFNAWIKRTDAWELEQDHEWAQERKRSIREACRRHTSIARGFTGKVAARVQTIKPEEISAADAAKWLDIAVKVERLGLGMSTSNLEHAGPDGGPMELLNGAKETLTGLLGPLMADAEEAGVDSEPDE